MSAADHESAQWVRVTRSAPCPVCGKEDWCSIDASDGTVLCMRNESDRPTKSGGWIHKRKDEWAPPPPPPKDEEPTTIDAPKLAKEFAAAITAEQVESLAAELCVDPIALRELGIGSDGYTYTFPMYGPNGAVCGIRRRLPNGKKIAIKGSKNGVFRRLHPDDGNLLVTEGESDTAAALSLGFDAIGIPGVNQAVEALLPYVRNRRVVLFADNDEAGQRGAEALARRLIGTAESVAIAVPPPEHKDIRDWKKAGATHAHVEAAIAAAITISPTKDNRGNEEQAGSDKLEWRPFPLEFLPRACRNMVELGAQAQGVDPGFWAVPMFPILAGCVGNSRRVRVRPGWIEAAVLWAALIAISGAGKSPGQRELIRPVREHDLDLHKRTEARLASYESQLAAWNAMKPKDRDGQEKPLVPPMLASLVEDCTTEGLAMRLRDNPRGLLLGVDELGGWLRSFDKYRGGGGDEQRWLSIHAAEAMKIDRKGSPGGHPSRIYVPNAAVSIVGTIQPKIARRYLGDEQRQSGLAARLLLASPPVRAAKWNEQVVPDSVKDDWKRVVLSLLDLQHQAEQQPQCLELDSEARDLFIAYHDQNGEACFAAGCAGEDDLAAALAKLRGAAPRIALVLALAAAAEEGTAETLRVIDGQSMRAGIEIASWFEREARRLYGQWRQEEERERVQTGHARHHDLRHRVADALLSGPKTQDDLRNLFHRNVPADEIRDALRYWESKGIASCVIKETGGRPAEVWRINHDAWRAYVD